MDEKHETIGLAELMEEIERDLDELRKKHSTDYNVKTITMWWQLKRERVMTRHASFSVVKKLRKAQTMKRLMVWFFAGWLTMLTAETIIKLVVH